MESQNTLPHPPSLVAQVGTLYLSIYKACDKVFSEQNFPLQMDQIPVLLSLFYSGGASQKSIGIALGRDKASINRTVSLLLKKGMIEVIPDLFDKRKTYVELTLSGKILAKKADDILVKFDEELASELTAEQRIGFNTGLRKLVEAVTRT